MEPSWDSPVVVNFYATTVILLLSFCAFNGFNLIRTLTVHKMNAMLVVGAGYLLVPGMMKSLQEWFVTNSYIMYPIVSYIMQVCVRILPDADYSQLVKMLDTSYFVDVSYPMYPMVGDKYDKYGNVRVSMSTGRTYFGEKMDYNVVIQQLKKGCKTMQSGRDKSKYINHIKILHEMSTKNYSNAAMMDKEFMKGMLETTDYVKLLDVLNVGIKA